MKSGPASDALQRRFERIAQTLDAELLSAGPGNFEDEVFRQLTHKDESRLLGFYGQAGLLHAFEAYGLLDRLRSRGYADFEVRFELEELRHTFWIESGGHRLMECRLRRTRGSADPCIAEVQRRFMPQLLYVEWLQLQDPRGRFTAERPALPGQLNPGTGLGEEVLLLFYLAARRLGLDGILDVPERFHNAVFYRSRTHFIDPAVEGRFAALCALLEHHSLPDLAWAMEEGRVVDEHSGAPLLWEPREQLFPLHADLAAYFESAPWRKVYNQTRALTRPRVIPRP